MATYSLRKVVVLDKAITADINANAATIEAAMNSFPGGNIQSNTILGSAIKSNSIAGSKLLNGTIDSSKLGTGAVVEGKIGAAAVTEAKLGNLAVATGKIAAAAVTVAKLAAGICQIKVGTYPGDGAASNAITGVGFTPIAIFIVRDNGNTFVAFRTAGMTGTCNFQGAGAMPDGILSLDADGFTVGSNTNVNQNGKTSAYLAFGTT